MTQGNWLRQPNNDLSVIFIHGINSSEECWRNPNGTYWPELLKAENDLSSIGIYVFTYRTGISGGYYSLGDVVDSLKENLRLDNALNHSQMIFVCHSMGGIVARRFLVSQQLDLLENGLEEAGLFLIASPSLGSRYANLLSIVSKAVGHTQADALRFSQSNTWLNDLDKDFRNLKETGKLAIKGKELIEDLSIFSKICLFFKEQIVEPFAAARYFDNPFKVPGSDHSTIARPESASSIQHRLLCDFIKTMKIDVGSHDGVVHYQNGKQEDLNLNYDRNTFPPPITVNRYRDYQERRKQDIVDLLEIINIDVRRHHCHWDTLHEIPIHPLELTGQEELSYLYELSRYSFHQTICRFGVDEQGMRRFDSTAYDKVVDPILDVTVRNKSDDTVIITRLFVAPLAAWTIPKAYPMPGVIKVMNAYTIPVDFTKKLSRFTFDDPLFIPAKGPWRFTIHLKSFDQSLSPFGNESLITIGIEGNNFSCESKPIYLGIN
ncbi:alpha/beta fold hydrolase [Fischerella sp. PCC 9605]|uniref:alpha/beta fold hydrolase n=1 Tax=Fischerella sp. PCC 9605 TaxID=1173024 RepID=UPI0004B19388|nr:alpha/beta fold hydrolase [Fischerella sp. PCC 9605]